MNNATVVIPKDEYDIIRNKANLFDQFIENEELTAGELKQIKKALKGPFLTRNEFLNRHPELL